MGLGARRSTCCSQRPQLTRRRSRAPIRRARLRSGGTRVFEDACKVWSASLASRSFWDTCGLRVGRASSACAKPSSWSACRSRCSLPPRCSSSRCRPPAALALACHPSSPPGLVRRASLSASRSRLPTPRVYLLRAPPTPDPAPPGALHLQAGHRHYDERLDLRRRRLDARLRHVARRLHAAAGAAPPIRYRLRCIPPLPLLIH